MARPKKYATEEERLAARKASNAASQRTYRERNPDKATAIKRKYEAREREEFQENFRGKEFVALDGEGLENRYVMIAASDGSILENYDDRLHTKEVLRFLCDLGNLHPDKVFVGFAFGYDSENILRDLSRSQLEELAHGNHCNYYPNGKDSAERYWIDYFPRKWLKIYRYDNASPKVQTGRCIIWDVFGFFQSTFIKAVKDAKIATEEELALLKEGKERRGSFSESDNDFITRYNNLELALLVKLMGSLNGALCDLDIRLAKWHGAGAVAGQVMRLKGVKAHIEEPPTDAARGVAHAYFGGRFQCGQIGEFEGRFYNYDINSAYPYAMSLLPSLANGRWEPVSDFRENARYALYYVEWAFRRPFHHPWFPFPYRLPDYSINYPPKGRGYYWQHEVATAIKHFGKSIKVLGGWEFIPATDALPFHEWINDYARKRLEFKATGDYRAQPLKLALNSLYGKLAQGNTRSYSKNGKEVRPPFQSYVYAGMITSHTRAMVLDAIMQAPTEGVSIATDGVFTLAPLQLDIGPNLGQWGEDYGENFCCWQPGIFCYEHSPDRTDYRPGVSGWKARGVLGGTLDWEDLKREWQEHGLGGRITAASRRFYGHKLALRQGLEKHCQWEIMPKEIALHPGSFNVLVWNTCEFPLRDLDRRRIWFTVESGANYKELSAPYRKHPAYSETMTEDWSAYHRSFREQMEEQEVNDEEQV